MFSLILITCLTLLVLFVRQRYSYWRVRGVPSVKPWFPFGNLWGVGRKKHLAQVLLDCYEKLNGSGPFGGVHFFLGPVVVALELDFVKNVLVKDFNHFHDRSLYYNEKDDPLTAHLFLIEGSKWKNLRNKLTPTFTSGKMKLMFPIVRDVGEQLEACLLKELPANGEIEIKDILARYTTDVIGICAFGLDAGSLKDPESEFRVMGRQVFEIHPLLFVKLLLCQEFKKLARAMRVTVLNPKVANFFLKTFEQNVEYRENNKIIRNDFMSLLIKLKNNESIDESTSTGLGKMTMNEIAAQAFVFFFAGFETSSTLMSFCLYELACNQEVQDKARANILETLERHGSFSYEAIHDMKYLENCINETLRKYPPAANIFRQTTIDYNVPGTKFTIEKGTPVMVPIYAIHHDAEHYPNPEVFDPDRFDPEQVAKRHPFAFLPFGEGPRICIGMRFAMMQSRVGLAVLLRKFRFRLGSTMAGPLRLDPSSLILASVQGMVLKLEEL
ncbi:cytochrome P450 6A1-like [Uranotaenia lowii]|uniref:cytochrome P450 6A1-like n=1 Tax=Uranotaenia lowii TaxID=190385 RepID=UPI002478B35C|nr:cytochrome P450 6A1-like [Uranotaenia lowii]